MNLLKLFCVLCLIGGKVMAIPNDTTEVFFSVDTLPEADYIVKNIIREKKHLFVIDLERSDSVFRIFSHFDGKKDAGDSKLHKHDTVRVKLIEPSEVDRMALWDRANRLDWNLNNKYYGVNIVKHLFRDPYYFEVRYCDDLNGPYLKSKKE